MARLIRWFGRLHLWIGRMYTRVGQRLSQYGLPHPDARALCDPTLVGVGLGEEVGGAGDGRRFVGLHLEWGEGEAVLFSLTPQSARRLSPSLRPVPADIKSESA